MKKLSLIIVCSSALTACSTQYTSTGEEHYRQARNGEIITVPAPLTGNNISHFYDLPTPNGSITARIEPPQ